MLRPQKVLTICAVFALLLIGVSVTSSGYMAIWSMIAVGLCNSIMFATIFSLSIYGLGSYTTKASGLLSTSIVGGAVISVLLGLIKDSASWSAAFSVPALCYAYIIFYGINGHKTGAQNPI